MIEVELWIPYLFLVVGFLLGTLIGAKLTVDSLRRHGWGPGYHLLSDDPPPVNDPPTGDGPPVNLPPDPSWILPRETVLRGAIHWETLEGEDHVIPLRPGPYS